MTLATTSTKAQFNGNGSTTAFPFSFKFTAASEVEVILTSSAGVDAVKTITTHYTLSSPGDSGTVTMITAPATGEVLTVRRIMPLTQTVDLTAGGSFSAAVVEAALDKLSMITQQLLEKIRRAAKFRDGSTTSEVTLPEPSASAVLAWNSGGTDLENKTLVSIGSATFPASATDNAVPRFDGTGGSSLQNSGVTIDDSNNVAGVAGLSMTGSIAGAVNVAQTGYTDISEISTPGNPASNVYRLFSVDSGGTTRLRTKDASGNVRPVDQVDIVVFDGVGDDSTDDGPALQTALDNANGRTVRLVPGRTYRIGTAVRTDGKSWHIDARGARVHFDANINGLTAVAAVDNLQNVSAHTSTTITVADGSAFSAGDKCRFIAEDRPSNARTVISGDTFKIGEPVTIASIAGNVLTLSKPLIYSSQFATNRRIFRMPLEEQVSIAGGEWYYTDGHDATPWAANMIQAFGLIRPRFEGLRCLRGYGSGLLLVGTQDAIVVGHHAERMTDNTGNGQFGYGLTDMGWGTHIWGLSGGQTRHLITTGALPPPSLTTDDAKLHWYGGGRGLRLIGGVCTGNSAAAFDTHHSTDDVVFSNLYAENCPYAVSIRSNNTRVTDVEGRNITEKLVYVFTEFYSVGVSDGIAAEDDWCNQVFIDNVLGDCVGGVLKGDRVKNLHVGRIHASTNAWRAFELADVQMFIHADWNITITDTASTWAGRGAIDIDLATAAGFTPQVEQYDGLIRISGSGSSGSATFAVCKSDGSTAIFKDIQAVMPNGSTGPLLITANSGTMQMDLNFDVNGSGESGVTLTSGSNITANVASTDGTKDMNTLRNRGRVPSRFLNVGTREDVTIASGVITITSSFMGVDTEGAAATDDLVTINGGVQGDIIFIRAVNTARTIVAKHGTGNIFLDGAADKSLDNTVDMLALLNSNGTSWVQVGFGNNGT